MTNKRRLVANVGSWLETHLGLATWIAAGGAVLTILVFAIVSFYQWRMTQRQLDAMQNAERGHVMLTKTTVYGIREIADGSDPEGSVYLSYTMTNYGQTPAWSTNRTFKVEASNEFSLPTFVPAYENPKTSDNTVYVVLPNEPFNSGKFEVQRVKIKKQEAIDIMAACADPEGFDPKCKKYLFIYGSIEYRDVFHNCHVSRFAYLYRFKGNNPEDAYRMPVGVPWYWRDEERKCA